MNNNVVYIRESNILYPLTKFKEYKILLTHTNSSYIINNDAGNMSAYSMEDFISPVEYREMKIDAVINNIP